MLDEEEGVKTENFAEVGGWGVTEIGNGNGGLREKTMKLVWAMLMRLWDI